MKWLDQEEGEIGMMDIYMDTKQQLNKVRGVRTLLWYFFSHRQAP